eukprot:scaffold69481_cov75-Phaeocystis_antarctica.AAC.2
MCTTPMLPRQLALKLRARRRALRHGHRELLPRGSEHAELLPRRHAGRHHHPEETWPARRRRRLWRLGRCGRRALGRCFLEEGLAAGEEADARQLRGVRASLGHLGIPPLVVHVLGSGERGLSRQSGGGISRSTKRPCERGISRCWAASHLARGDGRLEGHLPCRRADGRRHVRVAAPLARRQLDLERGAGWHALRHSDRVRLLRGRVGELHARAGRGVERDRER